MEGVKMSEQTPSMVVAKKELRPVFSELYHIKERSKRFTKYPVVVSDFQDSGNLIDFQKNVRKQVHKYGVACRVKTPMSSPTTSVSMKA